ncbi:hypothetical protein BKA67DRAFT_590385 [Truncatella angustata]|uniref:C3H1-type domain-containing protein n=1 Tax=Truncatella angustata TaxID=152316 RepID=A0A9P8UQ71_9PEZI|nr:uncharacterized protein BKA67DRAFT_590385 [Truncatella angustata]KAH6656213.1 hypothetical protein BKA67DRAFT_590385 [Truncatella angustata]
MVASVTDFVPRYRTYTANRDTTENFIKDLMIYAEHVEVTARQETLALSSQLQAAQYDYDDSVSATRELRTRIKELESQLSFLKTDSNVLKHRNPYALVLIDGNGLIFKDHLVRQGLEGGKKAAYALRQAVYAQVEAPDDTEILAKIYADLDSLCHVLDNQTLVRDFMLGFTQAKSTFEFIDIGGNDKLCAEAKITESARFNLKNYNCKQVFLGVSDKKYASFLDDVADDAQRGRVSVIEAYPVTEITTTGVVLRNFDAIFRFEKPKPMVEKKPFEKVISNTNTSTTSTSASASSIASTPVSVAATPFTYATITQKVSPPPQLVLPLAPKPTTTKSTSARVTAKPATPAWNPGPRGVDPPIPLNQNVLDVVKKRTGHDKLCNNHYLRGPCAKGDACCFEHVYQPNPDEIKAIQFLARLNPCTNGQDCDVDNCIYGHHCPSVKDGVCTHPFCKFHVHEHPPGTKIKAKKAHD